MSNLKRVMIIGCMVSLLGLLSVSNVSEGSKIEFSVETLIPDNQRDKSVTYFDLMMTPQAKQELIIKATNTTSEDIVVLTQVFSATTNSNGVVEYGESNTELDETASHRLRDIVTVKEPEQLIKANSTTDLKLEVVMPDGQFDGVLAGGIAISQKEESTKEDEKKRGMSIVNKFNYNIAILLRLSEQELVPKLALTTIKPAQINGKNGLIVSLKNDQPMFLNQVAISGKIIEAGKTDSLYEKKAEQMQIAPNTTLSYPFLLGEQVLKAGEYTLILNVQSNDQKWLFKEVFSISKEEEKELKKTIQDTTPIQNRPLFIISILTIICGCMIIGGMAMSKHKENSKQKIKPSIKKQDA